MARPAPNAERARALFRLGIGVAISTILLVATIARVDLARTVSVVTAASPLVVALGVAIVLVDLGLRALRWRVLLSGVRAAASEPPPYRLALAYLSVGYAANAVLPARLGDVARAILAGSAFGLRRLAIFGTILVERVSDGLTMLLLALFSTLVLEPTAELRNLAAFGLVVAVVAAIGLGVAWWWVSRPGSQRFAGISGVRDIANRVAVGADALRRGRTLAWFVVLTAAVTATAVSVAAVVADSVGVVLSPLEAVMFMSGVALSLAIPAAPGSLGTYEFVGVAIITSLGYPADRALAVMVVMRVVSMFPPVFAGAISLVGLQIPFRRLIASRAETT